MPTQLSVRRGAIAMYGLPELQERLAGIRDRLADPLPQMDILFRALEVAETHLFERVSPRFVLTGRTRTSLTEPDGAGAIREIHGVEARFGTSIWYAKFLRKIGGPSGKPRGRKREGPNLVLKLTLTDRRAAIEAIGEYVVRG